MNRFGPQSRIIRQSTDFQLTTLARSSGCRAGSSSSRCIAVRTPVHAEPTRPRPGRRPTGARRWHGGKRAGLGQRSRSRAQLRPRRAGDARPLARGSSPTTKPSRRRAGTSQPASIARPAPRGAGSSPQRLGHRTPRAPARRACARHRRAPPASAMPRPAGPAVPRQVAAQARIVQPPLGPAAPRAPHRRTSDESMRLQAELQCARSRARWRCRRWPRAGGREVASDTSWCGSSPPVGHAFGALGERARIAHADQAGAGVEAFSVV